MKKSVSIIFVLCFNIFFLKAQVGINNTNPTATLDVTGNVLLQKKLFLENPGDNPTIRGSKLLIQKTNAEVVQYDIAQSKYGPINYVEFAFKNVSTNGLQDYDTKISTTDYLVTVQGFYFLRAGTDDTNITLFSTKDNSRVEGFQMYAYKNTTTNTWFIRGFVNNSTFQMNASTNVNIDLFMNLIIFRNRFIAKPLNDVNVDMGKAETMTVALPAGF